MGEKGAFKTNWHANVISIDTRNIYKYIAYSNKLTSAYK